MNMRVVFRLLLGALLITACGKAQDAIDIGSGGGGGRGNTPQPGDETREVTVPAGTFKVDLTTPTLSSHLLHKAGSDFDQPCAIDPSATGADRFIDCEVEVDELDLLIYGLSFTATISAQPCEHVTYIPYYFLSAPAGYGPTAVSITIDKDAGTTTPDPNGFSFNGEPYCPFDYSYITGGPNCCDGEYTLTKTVTEGGNTKTETTTEQWGGKMGNCVSGAGTLNETSSEGWPKIVYTANTSTPGTGISISKTYSSIFSNFTARTILPRIASNAIVVGADHPASGTFRFLSTFYANYYNPAVWTGGPPDGLVHPYYTFTCLDSAHEETGQIRISVREWNITNSISPTNMAAADIGGFDSNGMPLNDMGDWDDVSGIVNSAPPAYSSPVAPEDFLYIREGFPYFHIRAN